MSDVLKKKKVNIPETKNIELDIGNDEIITIKPFLTIGEQAFLIKGYIDSLYNEDSDETHNYIMAEYSLVLGIIDMCTDIDIEGIDAETIINGGLWDMIKKKILSYNNLRYKIDEIVKRINAQKSIGNIVLNLIEKANIFLNKLLEIDTSKWNMEEIQRLAGQLQSAKKDLDNTIFNEKVSKKPVKGKTDIVQ
jgi:hypothetical protein